MYQNIVRQNITLAAVVLFVYLFGLIQYMKPAFLYNSDGSIREFGIAYKNKTILPIMFNIVALFASIFILSK